MNKALKHTIIAMATASLGFAAGCSSDEESAEGSEATAGSEEVVVEEDVVETGDATEASCGSDEAACGEGSCG